MSDPSLSYSYVLMTYNQAETVKEAVESALSQDCAPLEIVITDDCSADATFDVIEKTVAGYSGPHRVILNRNAQNLGLAGNIERAHQISSGDVIIVAAGDDMSLPHRCARLMQAFATGDPLLVCSYAQVIGPDGETVPGNFRTAAFYHSTDVQRAARAKALYIGATGAWRRALYDKYGPLDRDTYEDLVLGFRAALEGRVGVIGEELVKYRLGQGLTSSDMYHADLEAFAAHRERSFIANRAIMRQRIRDAGLFGVPEHSPVWAILKREEIKAALGVSFYQEERSAFARRALKTPLLGLHTWYAEARRRRKMQRRLHKG
ncbi:MAG: glycosyltransferase [Pseudomonadota bacterium]